MRNLFIEEWKEDEEESSKINYEHLENFYDTLFHVPVYKKRIDAELTIGKLYNFTFENNDDSTTYTYLIIRKDSDNIYYMVEYYEGIYHIQPGLLGENCIKCDVLNELGIDLLTVKPGKDKY